MINATKVYIVTPLFGRPEAFLQEAAALHYKHLCELMNKETAVTVYECDTLDFANFCEMYEYYDVFYYTNKDEINISPSNIKRPDSDAGMCVLSSVPSSDPAVQTLFLTGDEQPLKTLMKGKVPVSEDNIS